MDDKNENVVVYPASLVSAMLMFSFNGWMLLIAGIALGIDTVIIIYASHCNQSISIYKIWISYIYVFHRLGYWHRIRPSFLGLFTHMITYSQLFGIMGILGVVTLIIYLLVHGRKVKHQSI